MSNLPDPADILASLDLGDVSKSTRVVVAMSGGVDSSVVAGLLKHAGCDVVGVTLQLYDHGAATHRAGSCCAGQDIHDARQVAGILGIPHYVLDYERRFRETVMVEFAQSYAAGETPVPCISCNQKIKFVDMLDTAKELGAAALATGHYVARRPGKNGAELHQSRDLSRDQSYFLFATTRDQLDFLRFPLGDFSKQSTREMALEMGLPVADKSDSQDICFVPSGHYSDIVERLQPGAAEMGEIVHMDGRVLGHHKGILNYTIGQRRGIGIAIGEPLFVVKLDAKARKVIVGPREALLSRRIELRDLNWLGDGSLEAALQNRTRVYVRVRSTRSPQPAWLTSNAAGEVTVILDDGEEGVAPGQACVFYQSPDAPARILGGGWIRSVEDNEQSLDVQLADGPARLALPVGRAAG